MTKPPLPPASTLRKLLRYIPETGELIWRVRDPSFFTDGEKTAVHKARIWNARQAGRPAMTSLSDGYATGGIFNTKYRAHRVIWVMQTGVLPTGNIDHINGIRNDNRWCNLRDVSQMINSRNCIMKPGNASGVNGVTWYKRTGMWRAFIRIAYRQIHIGYYHDLTAAQLARKAAEVSYGFTERHGV